MKTRKLLQSIVVSLFLFFSVCLFAAESRTIQGTVTSEGETLIGASIMEKNTTNGTVTDLNGFYSLSVEENAVLVVSYIGYKTKEISVGNQTTIHIELERDATLLDEVVAIGYGVQQKKLLTGATVQVKGEDITRQSTVNILSALQNQTPGVQIIKNSGVPGSEFKVTVRGAGTMNDSSPLYVIDGIIGGDINTLNPSDIESIDVLKDAASSAIYGARAANGVILVTTRQGKKGITQISYDGYFGWQNIDKNVTPLGASDYIMMMKELGLLSDNDLTTDRIPMINSIQKGEWSGTNWLEEMLTDNAPLQNHAININKGGEQSAFSFGFSYTSQKPTIAVPNEEVGANYDRYTLRLNSEHTLVQLNDRDLLKFGENMSLSFSQRNGLGMATGNEYSNDIRNALNASPLFQAYDENKNFGRPVTLDPFEVNPLEEMAYTRSMQQSKNHLAMGNVYLLLEPVKDLRMRSSFGFHYSSWNSRSYVPAYDLNGGVTTKERNTVTQQGGMGLKWQLDNVLSYGFNVNNAHKFSVLLGNNVEKGGLGQDFGGSNEDVEFNDFFHAYLNNAKTIEAGKTNLWGSAWGESTMVSFFSRINYDYLNKYMATVVLRADGSSAFATGHKWGYFPSVSVGWNVMEEPFMEPARSVLDYLKIRASWGENGNNRIPAYRYLPTITIDDSGWYYFGNKAPQSIGSYPTYISNRELSWETSRQTNIGLDMKLLRNRLGINFDLYHKKTVDWLVQANALGIWGTSGPYVNGGDIVNKGMELVLNWNDHIGEFKYGISANFSHNKNEVVRIALADEYIDGSGSVLGHTTNSFYRAEVGKPLGYFYGYETNGIFQNQQEIDNYTHPETGNKIMPSAQPGDVIFVDLNNDGSITTEDRTQIGNPHPDLTYGVAFNMEYKGFDLFVNGYGVAGNQIAKSYRLNTTPSWDNYTTDMLGRWHGEGTSNHLPKLNGSSINWQYISNLYIEDGDYFRITNITIGYDFKKIFKSLPLQQLRMYVSGQNLITFTKYSGMDPDVSGYTGMQSWAKGIDLGYYPGSQSYLVGFSIKY